MDSVHNYDCPQYVNFIHEFNNNNDASLTDAEASSCSIRQDMEVDSMDVEEDEVGSSYAQDENSLSGSMYSTLSESYLADSSDKGSIRESEYQAEDFPVHHPENPQLSEMNQKQNVKTKTKSKPFHLTESNKRKRDEHIPLAEQIAAFHKKTPQRFHTTGPKAFEPMEHWCPQRVIPKSPNLQAAKRLRGVKVLSREEQEALEEQEIKQYKFRAQPVRYNVLHNRQLPKVGKKLPTKPRNFHLRTAQRAAEINVKKKEEEKQFEFHARPVPKSILSGPTGLKEKPTVPVTEAKTPNFALKTREQKWKAENKVHETARDTQKFKAIPAPAPTSPFMVKHEKKHTEIQPFSFDEKDKERMAKKEKKIAEEIEKENRVHVFKAQPIPSPVPSALPPVQKKHATRPEPFSFLSANRSFKHSSFSLSADQTYSPFKAKPATVLEKPAFVPEKSLKQPVEVKEFQLHTNIRASERQKLKEIHDIKEHEKELALERLRQLKEEEERKEVLQIRKEAVHKANPIRHYKPVEIKPSNKLPTQPMTPKFHTDERLQSRHQV